MYEHILYEVEYTNISSNWKIAPTKTLFNVMLVGMAGMET